MAAAPPIEIDRARWALAEARVLGTGPIVANLVFVSAVAAYTPFTSHDNMQEPFPEVTAIVRADWDRHFACGPGPYLGDRRAAHDRCINGDMKPIGVPLSDIHLVRCLDPEFLPEKGAALVFRGITFPAADVAAACLALP